MKTKLYTSSVRVIVAVACSICLSESTFGQVSSSGFSRTAGSSTGRTTGSVSGKGGQDNYDRNGPRSGNNFQQRSNTRVSGNRSVSFTKDGKRVSIKENASGISVSVNGQGVRAKDVAELKEKYPDAYRLYDEHIGAAQIRGTARASANGSAGSGGGGTNSPQQFNKRSSKNRSVSVMDNGKKVSITEHKRGITVSMNGKRVRAKNAAELKEKSPDAFRLYEKHLGAGNGNNGQSDATVLLQEELNRLRDENADNPRVRNLIDKMIQNRKEGQNDFADAGPLSGTGFQQRSSTRVSGSRSVSFTKDGKRGSIKENASGISVSVDGESVRAKGVAELKEKYPDAYRLYDEHMGAARIRGMARASANGSASSGGGGTGSPQQFNKRSSKNRSVSVMDNGKKVSITENKKGITVSMNGKRVRAKDAAELKEKSPVAFRMYEKHLGAGNGHIGQSDATDLLQEELIKFRDENADNPRVRNLIEKMMQNVPQ